MWSFTRTLFVIFPISFCGILKKYVLLISILASARCSHSFRKFTLKLIIKLTLANKIWCNFFCYLLKTVTTFVFWAVLICYSLPTFEILIPVNVFRVQCDRQKNMSSVQRRFVGLTFQSHYCLHHKPTKMSTKWIVSVVNHLTSVYSFNRIDM